MAGERSGHDLHRDHQDRAARIGGDLPLAGTATDGEQFEVEPWIRLNTAVAAAGGRLASTIGVANVFELDGVIDLELGFVTDELLPPGDGYLSRVLDGGEFASVTFDRWADKAAAYEELWRWIGERRMTPRGPGRERASTVGRRRSCYRCDGGTSPV